MPSLITRDNPDPLVDGATAARLAGVSRQAIWKAVKRGDLPVDPVVRRMRLSDVRAYIHLRRRQLARTRK